MPERDPLVSAFRHLADLPRAKDALHALKRVASLVKPIMRARNFKVQELAEFYPGQANLLGVNHDAGKKICLRLRHPGAKDQFLPFESVVDTMLHELCHNVHGPHNRHFHALWDQLRDELQGLLMKGYTGEGFLSAGSRLGGSRMPAHEINRLARQTADSRRQRRFNGAKPGHRLGGAAPPPGEDIREVIVGAVGRRTATLMGCGTERLTGNEIRHLADAATRNGFRTQAEEDEANEAAIAQALWELVQEDERAKYGTSYIPPSAENPIGNGGGSVMPDGTANSSTTFKPSSSTAADPSLELTNGDSLTDTPGSWTCETCTLQNPPNYLCCDACGGEKTTRPPTPPPPSTRPAAVPNRPRQITVDLTADTPPKRRRTEPIKAPAVPVELQTWMCSFCGAEMERQWWTCSTCGNMKESSR